MEFNTQNYLLDVIRHIQKLDISSIDALSATLLATWETGNTIFTCGNGGSSASASHLACDLTKFTRIDGVPPVKAISLCDNNSLISALTNDWGFDSIFLEQLRPVFAPGDALVAISVHGGAGKEKASAWSQNILRAAKYTKDNGGTVLSLTGYDGGPLAEISDVSVVVRNEFDTLSTPIVESIHPIIHHLVCESMRTEIKKHVA